MFSISQVLVGSAPLKPYGFDKGCKHTYIAVLDPDFEVGCSLLVGGMFGMLGKMSPPDRAVL